MYSVWLVATATISSHRAAMSAVYSEASKLLQHYLNKEAGLKTLLFAQRTAENPSHKKQYKLVAETLRCQTPLHTRHITSHHTLTPLSAGD